MYDYHKRRLGYFNMQYESTTQYWIPLIEKYIALGKDIRVLEVGCGEGGNLLSFAERGCDCVGIDLETGKIEDGRQIFKERYPDAKIEFIAEDIYNQYDKMKGQFHVILLKDTIEHIHDQQKLINYLCNLCTENGILAFSFPPWQMPFGGHQQMMVKKWASMIPYTHLLPGFLYPLYLKVMGESKSKIAYFKEVKETGISIERIEKCFQNVHLKVVERVLYFINPNYKWKFGLKPRVLRKALSSIPFFRNFLSTAAYYIVKKA